jgi:A118 family predicted phage portal protein
MANITSIIKFLRDANFAVETNVGAAISYANELKLWDNGFNPEFHKYSEGKSTIKRNMFSLAMAKKVGEDYATLIVNERTLLQIEDANTEKFLIGDKLTQRGGILGKNRFWSRMVQLGEQVFGYAGAGIIATGFPQATAKQIKKDGMLINEYELASLDNMEIRFIPLDNFIPLTFDGRDLSEVCLWSYKTIGGVKYVHLEIHSKDNSKDNSEYQPYVITNILLQENEGAFTIASDVLIKENIAEKVYVPCKMFSNMWNSAIVNNKVDCPIGLAPTANAIDCIKQIDLAFNNFARDIQLGRKQVFIREDFLATKLRKDGSGKQYTAPRDDNDLIKPFTGQDSDKEFFKEFNPSLRSNENKEVLQNALNMLSMKAGFGNRWYSFDNAGVATAQEVKTTNFALTATIEKQRTPLIDAVVDYLKGLCIANNLLGGETLDLTKTIDIIFDDSTLRDPETEKTNDRADVMAGLMTKAEYRLKWGLSKKDSIDEDMKKLQAEQPASLFDIANTGGGA